MLLYAEIADSEKFSVNVATGTDVAYYQSIGMTIMDVEQAYNGEWYVAGHAPVRPLAEAKALKYAENDQKADEARVNNAFTVTVDGVELAFLTDRQTQLDLQTAFLTLSAGASSYPWIDENGTAFEFTDPSAIAQVSSVFAEIVSDVYPKWAAFKAQIDNATTTEAVEAIVIDYSQDLNDQIEQEQSGE